MVRARKKPSPRSPAADPIAPLAKHLLVLWDAQEGTEREHYQLGNTSEIILDEKLQQLDDWRNAVETVISFTPARDLEGVLVQLVLALDTLDDVLPVLSEQDRKCGAKGLKIERLLRSAIRAVRAATRTESETTAQSIASIYSGDYDGHIWTDRVKDWSEEGRLFRERAGR